MLNPAEGPDTVNDVLNLDDCRLPKDQRKNRPEQADSPELVAFDFATGGVVADDDALGGGLEDDLPPQAQGLVDFHSKELDDLLEQIDSDDGADAGVSRFSSFFNKPQTAPSNQTPGIDSLQHHPRSELGLRVQQQLDQRRPMVDPSVWAAQQHAPPQPPTRPMAPPQLAADPAVLDMRSLQGNFSTQEFIRWNYAAAGFSKITNFLDRILMEHTKLICSLEFELILITICSIRTHSRS